MLFLYKIGLSVAKSDYWTRFNNSGNNSNIDIIVYSTKLKDMIDVHFNKHNPNISDHVGIQVELKNTNFDMSYEKRKTINKKWMFK